eukprot:TRINITY_DN8432_c0_g1_i1.p1 TRINITY_DN8432_c0_g1~~TRINITY_DN8432_c0_g1_i1.p1  ORF type:complete len:171 (-),score=76.51 TRINITY_DN8432_c0_g1_i1:82-543(-)
MEELKTKDCIIECNKLKVTNFSNNNLRINNLKLNNDNSNGYDFPPPPTIKEIGPNTWCFLHTTAAYFPKEPTEIQKQAALNLLDSIGTLFPCSTCASDFKEYTKKNTPIVNDNHSFSKWLCEAHNYVNEGLDKPLFDCTQVLKRWKRPNNDDF